MGRSRPVVVSDQVQIADLVDESDAGLVVPLSPEALSSAMLSILDDPERAREMGRRGRCYVEKHMTWENAARQTKAFYELVSSGLPSQEDH